MAISIFLFVAAVICLVWAMSLFIECEEEGAVVIGIIAVFLIILGVGFLPEDAEEISESEIVAEEKIKPEHPLASGILLYQEESPSPMKLTMGMYQVEISPADVLSSETDSVLQSWGWAKDDLSNSYIYN